MRQFTLLALICTLGVQAISDHTPYIIGGHPATHKPYNAYFVYLNAQNAGFFGGGSIVSDRHIITSAQNIYGFVRWDVGVGSHILAQLTMTTSTTAIAHPNFNTNRANDIGIITLPTPLIFTPTVAPIMLPAGQELPLENEQGTIVGFGFTTAQSTGQSSTLMRSFQRVINDVRCQQLYQNIILPNHFCAEDTVEMSNICSGDVGAGFVTEVRGNPMLTGVASLMITGCGNTSPSAYTRISSFRLWIQQVTGV
ncbi:collagenase-like [Sabethes cyaneus]|uniref:collagenase-like n=1 Tax=Sabethes cyaneus TaxID=53552 RepID=UPI00237E4762|nr:collagenase-like [Sabethes cyaneus]